MIIPVRQFPVYYFVPDVDYSILPRDDAKRKGYRESLHKTGFLKTIIMKLSNDQKQGIKMIAYYASIPLGIILLYIIGCLIFSNYHHW